MTVEYNMFLYRNSSYYFHTLYLHKLPANPQKKSPKSNPLKLGPPYSRSINVTESKKTRGTMYVYVTDKHRQWKGDKAPSL